MVQSPEAPRELDDELAPWKNTMRIHLCRQSEGWGERLSRDGFPHKRNSLWSWFPTARMGFHRNQFPKEIHCCVRMTESGTDSGKSGNDPDCALGFFISRFLWDIHCRYENNRFVSSFGAVPRRPQFFGQVHESLQQRTLREGFLHSSNSWGNQFSGQQSQILTLIPWSSSKLLPKPGILQTQRRAFCIRWFRKEIYYLQFCITALPTVHTDRQSLATLKKPFSNQKVPRGQPNCQRCSYLRVPGNNAIVCVCGSLQRNSNADFALS